MHNTADLCFLGIKEASRFFYQCVRSKIRLTYEIFTSGLMRSSAGVEMLPNLTNIKGERVQTCVADDTRKQSQ